MNSTATATISPEVTTLNSLLRGEMSAIETYELAIRRIDPEHATQATRLRGVLAEHQEATRLLRTQVEALGGQASDESGAWGAYAKVIEASAAIFGDTAALKALKEGEEHGMKVYQDAAAEGLLGPTNADLIAQRAIPNQSRHIVTLDRMIEELGSKN